LTTVPSRSTDRTATNPAGYRYATLVAAGAALGAVLSGMDTSTVNASINGIGSTFALDSGSVGFVTAIVVSGALVVVGALACALATGEYVLGVCRVVVGLGIGIASAIVPAYITEISPTAIRGRLGSLWQLGIVSGLLGLP
jgi:MFS transporter, SP family, sugar:H+ symporter